MDVQCAQMYLHEMHIAEVDSSIAATQAFNSFLVVLHAMDQKEVAATFRSAAQLFESNRKVVVDCSFFGKHEIPGKYVNIGAARVNCFIGIIQLEKRIMKANFSRWLSTWLTKQGINEKTVDLVVNHSRVFTTRHAESMGLRCASTIDIDPETRSNFERLRSLPEDEQQSKKFRELLVTCTTWMDDHNIPDEVCNLPVDELHDAVIQYSTSGGTSAAASTDGLAIVDRNVVEICDVHMGPTGPPTTYGPAAGQTIESPADDSCDELERELVKNQTSVPPSDPAEQVRLQRREHKTPGYALFRTSTMPGLSASSPKQRVTLDESADILVEQFHEKYGTGAGAGSFSTSMLQIAACYRAAVDDGRLGQKDRLSTILPMITTSYKRLFERKAAAVSTELKDGITRIVLRSKCKNCGCGFVPSDQSIYGLDDNGAEVVVGKKGFDTRNFCGDRCEQRWQCFRCQCGRPLQPGRFGLWINPKCSMCAVARPVLSFRERDNILAGLDKNHQIKQYYPRF